MLTRSQTGGATFVVRRNLGAAPLAPITMIPPAGAAIYKSFTLESGVTYRPNFSKGARVIVSTENAADARALENEGWSRET